ncbi:MAG TPA: glucokinase [Candidatus Angelobacter sp.]|nr:glucokinase [Candidatus Angelobacter sp.]
MILAGDIGGTHSRLGLFNEASDRLHLEVEKVYPSHEHSGLAEMVTAFLSSQSANVSRAAFGIAGPVINGRVSTPNLPWVIDEASLAREAGIADVELLNDLEAHGSGVYDLQPADFVTVNTGVPAQGNAALIAAGTGLGEAGLFWDGSRRRPFPCEGGHCDFAPRNELEIALLDYLLKKFGHVSYERILSGAGLKNIYDFLRDCGREEEPSWLRDELAQTVDQPAAISQHGMKANAAICQCALDVFISVYGAEAGNVALKLMATGGVFISGGIAARITDKFTEPAFFQAFVQKGRLQPLLEMIPVKVIINDRVGLFGAARRALGQRESLNAG